MTLLISFSQNLSVGKLDPGLIITNNWRKPLRTYQYTPVPINNRFRIDFYPACQSEYRHREGAIIMEMVPMTIEQVLYNTLDSSKTL